MTPDFTTFLLTAPAHEQPRDEHEKLVMEIAYRQGFADGMAEVNQIMKAIRSTPIRSLPIG